MRLPNDGTRKDYKSNRCEMQVFTKEEGPYKGILSITYPNINGTRIVRVSFTKEQENYDYINDLFTKIENLPEEKLVTYIDNIVEIATNTLSLSVEYKQLTSLLK